MFALTLLELSRDLFVYLVKFREMASNPSAPPPHQARADLVSLFDRMEVKTRQEPELVGPYASVRQALAMLADEVMIHSGWPHAREWRQVSLERQLFGVYSGPERFFAPLAHPERLSAEVAAVYYLCLALGYNGGLAPDGPELAEAKRILLARLPEGSPPALPQPVKGETPPAARRVPRPPRPALSAPPPAGAGAGRSGGLRLLLLAGGGVLLLFLVGLGAWHLLAGSSSAPVAPAPAPQAAPAKPAEPAPAPAAPAAPATPSAGTFSPAPPAPAPAAEGAAEAAPAAPAAPVAAGAPPPSPDTATEAPALTQETPRALADGYQVWVAVFVGPSQAERLARRLRQEGYPVQLERLTRPDQDWHLVKIVPIATGEEAQRIAEVVGRDYQVNPVVRKIKP